MIQNLVSVIIPTFNRAHLIKRSAMSVLKQTYTNLELLIVDDGSTDNTEEIVKSIEDSRIIYIKQSNQGACAARNNGIDHAKGEYIAFQDSDDVWHNDKLEKQLECLKKTGADLVVCYVSIVGSVTIRKSNDNKFLTSFKDFIQEGFGVQTFFAKSEVFKTEKFDINLPRGQDTDVLLRIYKKYKIYKSSDRLVDYYMQNDSISLNTEKLFEAMDYLIPKHIDFQNRDNLNVYLQIILRIIYDKQMQTLSRIYKYHPITKKTKFKCMAQEIGLYQFYRYSRHLLRSILIKLKSLFKKNYYPTKIQ